MRQKESSRIVLGYSSNRDDYRGLRTRHLGVTNENSKGSRTKVKEGHHDLSERKNICVKKGNTEVSQGRKRAGRVK